MQKAKSAYRGHKANAKLRGIDFNLTFNEWYNWWLSHGIDKNQKQKHNGSSLCMCRYNDTGPYELQNIYCDTRSNNVSYSNKNRSYKFKMKRIKTPDGIFDSRKAAAEYYNIAPQRISHRVKTQNDYEYLD